ncbi:hypothetical protein ABEB36_006980 [Hypothenemus hampei]|uniref:CS domain-containing protein n=1 Tax=Hypothenemus hampei TaxID=57062 RepID=A0ABD1ESV6_HYPHA
MPIIIKNFTWNQTSDKVSIQVPISPGTPLSKIDIFTSPQYLKAAFESFFFEVLLSHPVDIERSSCTKTSECIFFDLKKLEEVHWDSLEIENILKEDKIILKLKLIKEEHERIQKNVEEKRNQKAQLKRFTVNEQIKLDTRTRNVIEEKKKNEENEALGDLNKWKKNVELKQSTNVPKPLTREYRDRSIPSKTIDVPKPRNARSLQILFTPRELPTPSRESRREEENEFLAKQAEARRSAGFISEDLRAEEKNPQYLLAKGQEFLKTKNYLGAISAFSFGIKISPNFVDLYLARSEVHLLIGNFSRAVDDCTKALQLYKPLSSVNLHERAVCLGRRGMALYKLGFAKEGISELQASLKLEENIKFNNTLAEYKMEYEKEQDNTQSSKN